MNRDYKTPAGAAPPDWRGLCEELLEQLTSTGESASGSFVDLRDRARAALAQPEPERQAAPVPVASDIRYEFSVYDEDYFEQVGGTAPTHAQALSEGQHYLAQYLQDGPHTLELRRVEVLPGTSSTH